LGQTEGEGERALLAFAGVSRGGRAIQLEAHVIAVRSDHGLPEAALLGCAGSERLCEVLTTGLFVMQAGGFTARTDGSRMFGHERSQFAAEFLPHASEVSPGGEERSVVGGKFASAVRAFLEQEVARAQGAVVGAEIFQIGGIALAAEEVEEAAALGGGAADQFDILVGKKRDQPGAQVFVGFALRQIVEEKFASLGSGKVASQRPLAGASGQGKALRPVAHSLGQRSGSGGLQAQKDADRFEDGRLATGVGGAQQVQARSRTELGPREAAEVVQGERGENHGQPVSIFPAKRPDVAKEELKVDGRRPNMGGPMQSLPGFRDFFPSDCARRNHITGTWRRVARSFGFREYDGPTLEPLDLYRKKNSGGEILGQLFSFTDKGEREVALRPEMTPTVARMLIAKAREYRKPIKWFSIAPFFRYEKQQSGRLREFLQLNCDLVGDDSPAADAEMVALLIETLRAFGLTEKDIVVRVSDRRAWMEFLAARGLADETKAREALAVIDKLERESPEELEKKLAPFGLDLAAVRSFVDTGRPPFYQELRENLAARGLEGFCELDLRIVRGLAYYTGLVFEVFDRRQDRRAIAGGGRFDRLLADLSGGKVDLPAIGFGIGDVVLGDLLEDLPDTRSLLESAIARDLACDVFVVVADESRRAEALGVVQLLRALGRRVDYPLQADKVARQFKDAGASGASVALVVGDEWPKLKVKNLTERTETELSQEALADWAVNLQTPAP
jgi:histidyl-tRNA synthetase